MHHPYQKLCAVHPNGDSEPGFILAASDSELYALSLKTGNIASLWHSTAVRGVKGEFSPPEDRPNKKQKLEKPRSPGITDVKVTKTQTHVVVVTDGDKSIIVLSISPEGVLQQQSQRIMPKRPCVLAILPDDKQILVGDKSGDLYSIPLLQDLEEDRRAMEVAKAEAKPLRLNADETTVHSKSNRRILALQSKQEQDGETQQTRTKEPLAFAHQLLLGHVSILTDVLAPLIDFDGGSTRPHQYILTSDRDEHIRVSRGPPQSHVIESYCLGHREFVSRLCLVDSRVLVSGGGDDDLFVWDWLKGELVKRIPLKDSVRLAMNGKWEADLRGGEDYDIDITISGMWLHGNANEKRRLLVACEGIPVLLHCSAEHLSDPCSSEQLEVLHLDGNPLDVCSVGDHVIISIDSVHVPGSTSKLNGDEGVKTRLRSICFETSAGETTNRAQDFVDAANQLETRDDWRQNDVKSLLYWAGELRKVRGSNYEASLAGEQSVASSAATKLS